MKHESEKEMEYTLLRTKRHLTHFINIASMKKTPAKYIKRQRDTRLETYLSEPKDTESELYQGESSYKENLSPPVAQLQNCIPQVNINKKYATALKATIEFARPCKFERHLKMMRNMSKTSKYTALGKIIKSSRKSQEPNGHLTT
jgi:hypothetical protein